MADNTSGGTTASLSNTPQAKADTFYRNEDLTGITLLDVMLNDLAGNAKILWSVDDSATDAAGAADLIATDIGKIEATSTDTSANGAKIWIQDGKVAYQSDSLSTAFKAALQALAVGQTITDTFTYAIRMSNGTLSWNTATIVFTGVNDGPVISVGSGDSASESIAETDSGLSSSGTLTVVDPDTSDTVAVAITGFAKSGNAGSLTDAQLEAMLALTESSLAANSGDAANLHWAFNSGPVNFDYLAAGELLTLTYTIAAEDNHGSTDTQTVTITVTGTNDGPAVVAGGAVNGGVEEESGTYSASGSFGFTDVDSSDTHSVSVTPADAGYLGSLTPSVADASTGDGSGTIGWSFSVDNADLQFLGEGETRNQTYTVTVDDGHGGTASETVTVVLTGDNDPVVITSAAQADSLSEDGTSVSGTISFSDVDLSDTHSAVAAPAATNTTSLGTFSIDPTVTEADNAANGSLGWTYTIDNAAAQYLAVGETAVEQYEVTFSDGHGGFVMETVTVSITGSNDSPDIRAIAGDSAGHDFEEANSGLSVSGTLTVTDPDASDEVDTSVAILVSGNQGPLSDGDLLAMFSITSGGADLTADSGETNNLGWSFDSAAQAFDFLAEGQVLTLTYTLTSEDGNGGTDAQDVIITIAGTNDGPVAFADSGTTGENTPLLINVLANDTDADAGAVLTVTAASAPAGQGTAIVVGNQVQFDPGADFDYLAVGESAVVVVGYSIVDEHGAPASSTIQVTVTGVNDGPVALAVEGDADEDGPAIIVAADFTDADASDTHTFSVDTTATLGSVTNHGDGTFTYDPNGQFESLAEGDIATDTFSYTVDDGHGGSSTETVTITITGSNDAPTVTALVGSVGEDGPAFSQDPLSGAADVDAGTTLSVVDAETNLTTVDGRALALGTHYTLTGSTFALTAAGFALFNNLAQADSDSFTFDYGVSDGLATTANTLTVTIDGTNDAPTVTALVGSVGEDGPAFSQDLLSGAADVDAGTTLSVVDAETSLTTVDGRALALGTHYTLTGSTFELTAAGFALFNNLADGDSDSFTFDYGVSDGLATTANTLTVTIDGTNDGPVANLDGATTGENATVLMDVLANDTDADNGAVLTVTAASAAVGQGSASIVGNQVEYDPGTDFDHLNVGDSATVTISYTIEDEHGAGSSSTIDVLVTGTNDGPIANVDSGATSENAALLINVLGNDDDVDDGHILTVVAASAPLGQGTASVVGNQVEFDPGTDFDYLNVGDSVTVAVSYTIEDEHGASSNSTIDILVTGTNDGPVAASDNDSGFEDAIITGSVATNDTDADNGHILSYAVDGTAPIGFTMDGDGNWSLNAAHSAYQHIAAGSFEDFTVDYLVTDEHGESDSATLTIRVHGVNDAPVGFTDGYELDEDTTLVVPAASGVLANDGDPDNEPITAILVSGPEHGTLVFNDLDGSFTYTPDADYFGPDSFVYKPYDGTAEGDPVTVNLTVNPVDDGPTTVADIVLTNTAVTAIPEWALLYNDIPVANAAGLDIAGVNAHDEDTAVHNLGTGQDGNVTFTDVAPAGGSFDYAAEENGVDGNLADVNVTRVTGSTIAGTSANEILITANSGAALRGNGGDDILIGGTGNDQYIFGLADGSDIISDATGGGDRITIDTNPPTNSTSIASLNFERVGSDLVINVGGTQITVRGQYSGTAVEQFSFDSGGTIFGYQLNTTGYQLDLDLSGVGTSDIIASTSGPEGLTGGGNNDLLFGNGGIDTIDGGAGNDLIMGGAGDDILSGGNDNDTIVGAAGFDTLTGGVGGGVNNDTFVLTDASSFDTITDYVATEIIDITTLLTTAGGSLSGFVRFTAAGDIQLDADGGGNSYVTIAHINTGAISASIRYSTGAGTTATLSVTRGAPPIALDLDGDGQVSFLASDSGASFDYGGGAVATAWVDGNDGLLVRDGNHDGVISADELVFATSGSDLEGLAERYDSNGDGQLSDADDGFAEFGVWQDADSDGQVDAGELQSLAAHGIASISLTSDAIPYSAANGDVSVVGTGSFTRVDGTIGVLADAVFATGGQVADDRIDALGLPVSFGELAGTARGGSIPVVHDTSPVVVLAEWTLLPDPASLI